MALRSPTIVYLIPVVHLVTHSTMLAYMLVERLGVEPNMNLHACGLQPHPLPSGPLSKLNLNYHIQRLDDSLQN
jgi:hypothetical protein